MSRAVVHGVVMSENDLLAAVIAMAQVLGLKAAHFRTAQARSGNWITAVQGDGTGYPDLTIAGPGGMLFRELKSARGVLAPEQQGWITALTIAGQDAGVWKPADLQSGRIEHELRKLALAERGPQRASAKPAWMK